MKNKPYFQKVFTTYVSEYEKHTPGDTFKETRMTPAKRKRIQRLTKYATRSMVG